MRVRDPGDVWAHSLLCLAGVALLLPNFYLLWEFRTGRRYFFDSVGLIYSFNTVVFPVCLLALVFVGFWKWRDLRSRHLLEVTVLCAVFATVLAGVHVYSTHIEPNRIVVRHVAIPTSKTTETIRILHISDIQAAAVGKLEERAFEIMQGMDADLVIHTGDLLQPVPPASFESEFPKIQKLFDTLHPRFGIVNVYGNCDNHLRGWFEKHFDGVQTLDGREALLSDETVKIRIHGLSFSDSRKNADRTAAGMLAQSEDDEFTILLGHCPDFILSVLDLPLDLCLAGHTHGGQIRVPWMGPIWTASNIPHKWSRGYHETGQTRFNVSAGIGTEGTPHLAPIRFNCPAEMTLIELQPLR